MSETKDPFVAANEQAGRELEGAWEAAEAALRDAAREGFESDGPVCEWCGEVVPDGESIYAPFCSPECEREATRETYASVHPRPEEVG